MSKVFIHETNLTNISNAIRQKGNTANLLKPNQMGPAIDNIKTNAKLRPTFISFQNLLTVQSINLKKVITDKVKNMDYMFRNCSEVSSLDLSNFNTSNVTTMNGMFGYCKKLTSLDLSSFDTQKLRICQICLITV